MWSAPFVLAKIFNMRHYPGELLGDEDDPIVREVRRIRQEHATRFKYNVDLIAKDLKAQERASSRRYISLPPRRTKKPANQPPDTARDPSETVFSPGQMVFLKSAPSTKGAVVEVLPGQPETRVKVFVDGSVRTYYASQLQAEEQTDEDFQPLRRKTCVFLKLL